MRAQEFITELFAPGKKWQWSFTGSEEAVAVFHVGDIPYQFHAYTYADEDPTVWEVEFKNAARGQQGRSTKFGLTGTGNSAEVMSTIADIMREFLQRYQGSIKELTFSADEPSRQALYTRMAKRLLPNWEIVQSGKNFTLVAPEAVTEDNTKPQSAGCVIVAEDTGRWCFQQRSDLVDDPGVWAAWGGGVEPGETLEQAVRRELAEEGGYTGSMALEPLHKNSRYATFVARVPREFEPKINYESKDWCWVEPGKWPSPLHPGLEQALTHLNENFADGKKSVVDAVQKVLPVAQEIWFHGSRATGKHRKNSDTDILVVVPDDLVGDRYLAVVRILQKLSAQFDNYDIQPTKSGTNIYRIAQEEGQLLWSTTNENFADGKNPGRKGLSKRVGVNTKASVSSLRKTAKNSSGEKQRMAHWLANMKAGRAKAKRK